MLFSLLSHSAVKNEMAFNRGNETGLLGTVVVDFCPDLLNYGGFQEQSTVSQHK